MIGGKPAENASFSAAVVVAAVFGILRAYNVNVPDGVDAGAVVLLGLVAHLVTGWINRRQSRDSLRAAVPGAGYEHG